MPTAISQPLSRNATLLGAMAALLLAGRSEAVRAADPVEDLEAQYQTALSVLKKPPVTGILITEVQPESAAAAAGLRAGDILLEYYGAKVTTLNALSQQVAEAIARRLEDMATGKNILARVRRGPDEKSFVLPRELLGIRAVEVEAGVPGPRNPPPNPRGTLTPDWKAALQTLRTDGAPSDADAVVGTVDRPQISAAFRLLVRTEATASAAQPRPVPRGPEEAWTAWETCILTPEGDEALSGRIDLYHLISATARNPAADPAASPADGDESKPQTEHSTFTFRLRLGDYKTSPAFVLDHAEERMAAPSGQENMQFVAQAQRMGEKLQTTSGLAVPEGTLGNGGARTEHHENTGPLNAAPQWALPWIAAALPQEEGDALAVDVLSVRDMLPRPGYVLATRGRSPAPADPQGADATPASASAGISPTSPPSPSPTRPATLNDPWRVDLMHCGIVIESYWFTDQRRLLCVETQGPQSVIARRAENAKSAALPQEKKSAEK